MVVKNHVDSAKDQLQWKFIKGEAFDQADLGDPTDATSYSLCVYDHVASTPSLAAELTIDPGVLWTDKDPKGFQYKDKTGLSDGVFLAKFKPGVDGKTVAQLKAKGVNLSLPAPANTGVFFEQDDSVVVQLVNDAGLCLSSEFGVAGTIKNTEEQFKAK